MTSRDAITKRQTNMNHKISSNAELSANKTTEIYKRLHIITSEYLIQAAIV